VDGVVDPGEHGAVHLHPRQSIGVDHVGEIMMVRAYLPRTTRKRERQQL
jgi:hypothetical protein